MDRDKIPHWTSVHTIVFDFDGVFTDNKVWIDENGNESVRCDRGDGLAVAMLKRVIAQRGWKLNCFILSTETNPVVAARAHKLEMACEQGVSNKLEYLKDYLRVSGLSREGLVYIGNDLNDYDAMILSGFSIAPADAHQLIRQTANLVLEKKGGEGCVREFIEHMITEER